MICESNQENRLLGGELGRRRVMTGDLIQSFSGHDQQTQKVYCVEKNYIVRNSQLTPIGFLSGGEPAHKPIAGRHPLRSLIE